MGADRAIRIDANDDQLDGLTVAQALAAVVQKEKPDLVLMGKQTVDGDANQVPQMLAGLLGWPQVTFAAAVQVNETETGAQVEREIDNGVETKQVPFPAVFSVDLRVVGPTAVRNAKLSAPETAWEEGQRYPSLKGIMAAKKKPQETLGLAELLGAQPTPGVRVVNTTAPPARAKGQMVPDVQTLVTKLRDEAQLL